MDVTLLQLGMVATMILVAGAAFAWLRRQPDPLVARYRLSMVTLLVLGGVASGLWVAHWIEPEAFKAPRMGVMMIPSFLLLGTIHRLKLELLRRG